MQIARISGVMDTLRKLFGCIGVVVALTMAMAAPAWAQLDFDFDKPLSRGPSSQPKLNVTAEFSVATPDRPAMLHVTASPPVGWYIYSLKQQAPPQKTVVKLKQSDQYKVIGGFKPSIEPKVAFEKELPGWENVPLEEHFGIH